MTSAEVRLSAAEAAESVDGGEAVGILSLEAVRGMATALSQGTTVAREASRPSSACWELRVAAYNVPLPRRRSQALPSPRRRRPHLSFETMQLSTDAGLTMAVYIAEPGSPSNDALNLLASWAATLDQAETARATDGP